MCARLLITLFLFLPQGLYSAEVELVTHGQLRSICDELSAKKSGFASRPLARYRGHYTMVAYRAVSGSGELHEKEADVFVIERGAATLRTGGVLKGAHRTEPGELRSTAIENGKEQSVSEGDTVHIPAGVPHQFLLDKGGSVCYYVVKVSGQSGGAK